MEQPLLISLSSDIRHLLNVRNAQPWRSAMLQDNSGSAGWTVRRERSVWKSLVNYVSVNMC